MIKKQLTKNMELDGLCRFLYPTDDQKYYTFIR